MAFDPRQPRDKDGQWTAGSGGHNAGGGNRSVAEQIKEQHKSSSARLYPAIKHGERIYKGPPGTHHQEALPRSLRDKMDQEQKDFGDYGMRTGFITHKGHFIDEKRAMDYAKEHNLIRSEHKKYAEKSKTLISDWIKDDFEES